MTSLSPSAVQRQEPSIFEDDWDRYMSDNLANGFDSTVDFNTPFTPGDEAERPSWLDPQLFGDSSNTQSSLASSFDIDGLLRSGAMDGSDTTAPSQFDVVGEFDARSVDSRAGQTNCPVTFELENKTTPMSAVAYPMPPSLATTNPASPYPYASIENSPCDLETVQLHNRHAPLAHPLPILHRHQMIRRSVSEPPGNPYAHHMMPPAYSTHQQQPAMVFHRQGLYLGKPIVKHEGVARGRVKAGGRASKAHQPYTKDKSGCDPSGRRGKRGGRTAPPPPPRSVPLSRANTPMLHDVSTPASSFWESSDARSPFTRDGTPFEEVEPVLGAVRSTAQPLAGAAAITVSVEQLQQLIAEAVGNAVKGGESGKEVGEKLEDGDEAVL